MSGLWVSRPGAAGLRSAARGPGLAAAGPEAGVCLRSAVRGSGRNRAGGWLSQVGCQKSRPEQGRRLKAVSGRPSDVQAGAGPETGGCLRSAVRGPGRSRAGGWRLSQVGRQRSRPEPGRGLEAVSGRPSVVQAGAGPETGGCLRSAVRSPGRSRAGGWRLSQVGRQWSRPEQGRRLEAVSGRPSVVQAGAGPGAGGCLRSAVRRPGRSRAGGWSLSQVGRQWSRPEQGRGLEAVSGRPSDVQAGAGPEAGGCLRPAVSGPGRSRAGDWRLSQVGRQWSRPEQGRGLEAVSGRPSDVQAGAGPEAGGCLRPAVSGPGRSRAGGWGLSQVGRQWSRPEQGRGLEAVSGRPSDVQAGAGPEVGACLRSAVSGPGRSRAGGWRLSQVGRQTSRPEQGRRLEAVSGRPSVVQAGAGPETGGCLRSAVSGPGRSRAGDWRLSQVGRDSAGAGEGLARRSCLS